VPLVIASTSPGQSSLVVYGGGIVLIGIIFGLGSTIDFYKETKWSKVLEVSGWVASCFGALVALIGAADEHSSGQNAVLVRTLAAVLLMIAVVLIPPIIHRCHTHADQSGVQQGPQRAGKGQGVTSRPDER
jgi:multisubunit Na+/H+ antiporter MnhG subunit